MTNIPFHNTRHFHGQVSAAKGITETLDETKRHKTILACMPALNMFSATRTAKRLVSVWLKICIDH